MIRVDGRLAAQVRVQHRRVAADLARADQVDQPGQLGTAQMLRQPFEVLQRARPEGQRVARKAVMGTGSSLGTLLSLSTSEIMPA